MGDELYADAETSVWWDINLCQVPEGEDVESNIRSALRKAGYRGRVSIFVFGDVSKIPDADAEEALIRSEINVLHIPYPEDPFYLLYSSMFDWARKQGFPCNCLLISGDEAYSGAINQLKMQKVNVLLAHPVRTSYVLTGASDNAWVWDNLSAGKGPYKSILGSSQELSRITDPNPKGKQPTKEEEVEAMTQDLARANVDLQQQDPALKSEAGGLRQARCHIVEVKVHALWQHQSYCRKGIARLPQFESLRIHDTEIIWVDEPVGMREATCDIVEATFIGLDCKWNRDNKKGASIMQIATPWNQVYVIDLIKLYNQAPLVLDRCLRDIFLQHDTVKLGYHFQDHMNRLARFYGGFDCFKCFAKLLDVQNVFKEHRGSLYALTKHLLDVGLNKTRRNINHWETRPLTRKQLEYAALDAAVLIPIFWRIKETHLEWKSHIVTNKNISMQSIRTHPVCDSDKITEEMSKCRLFLEVPRIKREKIKAKVFTQEPKKFRYIRESERESA